MAAGAALGGCAKTPTRVDTTVWLADVPHMPPPILLLRMSLAPADDPARATTTEIRSQILGDASDRPDPFVFPMTLAIAGGDVIGPAVVTVEGLDWDSHAVVARGSTTAEVSAEQRTSATILLSAVAAAP